MTTNNPRVPDLIDPATLRPPPEATGALTEPWQEVEAEVEADVMDADLEGCGAERRAAPARPREVLPRSFDVTDADLAEEECEADLSHVDGGA
jgi:hypothetical protein